MGVFTGSQQHEPMHYGEVFAVWSYAMACKAALAEYQTLINHTGDGELKTFMEDLTKSVLSDEIRRTDEVLKANGVALPPAPPERPVANLDNIPPGARFYDQEIAAMVGASLAAGLVVCSQAIGQCIREDIATMFGQFHTTKMTYSARLLKLSKQKGWIITPPLHVNQAEPAHV